MSSNTFGSLFETTTKYSLSLFESDTGIGCTELRSNLSVTDFDSTTYNCFYLQLIQNIRKKIRIVEVFELSKLDCDIIATRSAESSRRNIIRGIPGSGFLNFLYSVFILNNIIFYSGSSLSLRHIRIFGYFKIRIEINSDTCKYYSGIVRDKRAYIIFTTRIYLYNSIIQKCNREYSVLKLLILTY